MAIHPSNPFNISLRSLQSARCTSLRSLQSARCTSLHSVPKPSYSTRSVVSGGLGALCFWVHVRYRQIRRMGGRDVGSRRRTR